MHCLKFMDRKMGFDLKIHKSLATQASQPNLCKDPLLASLTDKSYSFQHQKLSASITLAYNLCHSPYFPSLLFVLASRTYSRVDPVSLAKRLETDVVA